MIIAAIGTVVLIIGIWGFKAFSRLTMARNASGDAWSKLQDQLQKRRDLIPVFIRLFRERSDKELGVFESMDKLYQAGLGGWNMDQLSANETLLSQNFRLLLKQAESVPEVSSGGDFHHACTELGMTEDYIKTLAQQYNKAVRDYNNLLKGFPYHFLAQEFDFEPEEQFDMEYAVK